MILRLFYESVYTTDCQARNFSHFWAGAAQFYFTRK